jgi:stearoyl-CoA desaturase (delta-9 desaturase)
MSPARVRGSLRPTSLIGFTIVHLSALGVFAVGFSWKGVLLCLLSYYVRMFGVTAGFHRYFSHRSYRLNRFWQFCMAVLAMTSAQKGILWWAANHRHHHKYSDQPEDIHSPVQQGFWWSHMGWILATKDGDTDYSKIPDLTKYPELVWLDRNQYVPTMLYAVALALAFGPTGLFYGYFLATVLLWHGTFAINSLMHVFGKRVFNTTDDSRNSMILALVTMGEGWHNNHHYHPGSAAQGFRWWQIDVSYYVLLLLGKVGIVTSINRVPERLRHSAAAMMESTRRQFDGAVQSAGDAMHHRLDQLAIRWAAMHESLELARHEVLAELEDKRLAAVSRLETLQSEYAAAVERASEATSRRIAELRTEIEQTRLQLATVLERLIETGQSLATPDPATA